MNHFFALLPDEATRDRLQAVAERLQAWSLSAAWVDPLDYHLTVLFLGDLTAEEGGLLPYAVEPLITALPRPELRLAGLGATGTRRGGAGEVPRAVYAAARDPRAACGALHRELAECLGETPRSGAFIPHLTLCRPQPPSSAEARAQHPLRGWPHLLEAHGEADWGPCQLTHVALLRSEGGHLRYRRIAEWPLLTALP